MDIVREFTEAHLAYWSSFEARVATFTAPNEQAVGIEPALGIITEPQDEWQNIEVIRHDLPNVEYVEPVEDMRDFYRRCRLVLVPSLSEDAGTVAQEAALNGLPALVSDVGGLSETAGGSVLLRPLDVDGWVASIEALDDPQAYERVVERQHSHQARAAAGNLAALDCLVERVRELARP